MRCDDFICLGRTVPEESKKYGTKICMAGFSPELSALMRVYPLPIVNPIKARHECILELERNHCDTRRESWKLKDRGAGILSVSHKPVIEVQPLTTLLKSCHAESITELNERRLSLGMIELMEPRGFFRQRDNVTHPDQGMLFEIADEVFGAGAIDIASYIEFWDRDGKRHELQIREWGCYEWIRKNRENAAQLWNNLRLGVGRTLAIIGNQANRRTSWLIVKTFSIAPVSQGNLF
jgi:hypothetical protein